MKNFSSNQDNSFQKKSQIFFSDNKANNLNHNFFSTNKDSDQIDEKKNNFENNIDRPQKRRINLKKKNITKAEINVIPLIDVLLVLLIVFMITAETINSNVEINLPQAKNSSDKTIEKSKKEDIVIFVDSKGQINLNEKQFMNFNEFENFLIANSSLKSDSSKFSNEQEVILSSDRDVNYQKIIEILVALNNIGLNKIKMAYKNS